MTDAEKLAVLERHVNELAEIYDHIQIMGTWLRPDNTTASHKRGSGNWYARLGMAREFLSDNEAENTAAAIASKLEPPDGPSVSSGASS